MRGKGYYVAGSLLTDLFAALNMVSGQLIQR